MRERCADEALDPGVVLGQLGAPKRDERRVDVRPWSKDGARDRMEAGALGREPNVRAEELAPPEFVALAEQLA